MKAILFLCLLAFMACQKDIIDIGKCIYKAPKVQELIGDVIAAIVNQDFSKLLPKLKEALPDLVKIVLGCLIDTNAVEEQPKLAKPDRYECEKRCSMYPPKSSVWQACFNMCMTPM